MLTFAPFDVAAADQLAALVGLVEREERALLGEVDTTEGDLVSQLTGPDAVPGGTLAVAADGRLAGVAMLERIPQAREVVFDLRVDPEPPEQVRKQVRTALLDHCWSVLVPLATDDDRTPADPALDDPWQAHPGTWQLVTGIYATDTEGRDALHARELRHVRTFERLRIDGPGQPRDATPPHNVTMRNVATEADRRAAYEITSESFAEHWGSSRRSYEDWLALQRSRPGHDETLWTLAELDGTPVGVCLADRSREPLGYGYIATLGVLNAARRRGIADILLRKAIAASVAQGLIGTELVVDSANSTGAGELYSRVGMRSYRRIEVWLRPVPPYHERGRANPLSQ